MELLSKNVALRRPPIHISQRYIAPSTKYVVCTCSLSRMGNLSLFISTKPGAFRPGAGTRSNASFCIRASESDGLGGDAEEVSRDNGDEAFFIQEEGISSDPELRKGITDFSSVPRPSGSGNQLTQEQLQQVVNTLSQSLAVLSSALSEVSSAVRVLSATLSKQQLNSASESLVSAQTASEREIQREADEDRKDEPDALPEQPEPWDATLGSSVPTRNVHETDDAVDADNSVPDYLVEQNRVAHKLAYRLQQSFVQARIEGLGKPFQVAVEEFADTCMEAHSAGIGLKELQLQLILQDGSLTGAFAIRNQRFTNDPIFTELEEMEKPQTEERIEEKKISEVDGTDTFVKQVLKLCMETGYNLDRIKLEQSFAGETTSPSIKAMRQNQYLILLVVDKVQKRKQG
ncbi:hypothetical protein AXG93_653s1040 [Marchantia polymorpha subsp. ruderalis]|uniref:Uncharacterized protein n=1 Tax=Marchantia polymorpha subsp. ruderalis TaxID=1480154 RepID=A0A176VQR8_MARPO|nr:hypothetical protein AXG93_653s1040 [Marchantia polymorpha subsp. ruderalis]